MARRRESAIHLFVALAFSCVMRTLPIWSNRREASAVATTWSQGAFVVGSCNHYPLWGTVVAKSMWTSTEPSVRALARSSAQVLRVHAPSVAARVINVVPVRDTAAVALVRNSMRIDGLSFDANRAISGIARCRCPAPTRKAALDFGIKPLVELLGYSRGRPSRLPIEVAQLAPGAAASHSRPGRHSTTLSANTHPSDIRVRRMRFSRPASKPEDLKMGPKLEIGR